MKVIVALLLLVAFGFVVLLMLGAQTETTYTRVAVSEYERLRLEAENGDISQAASALRDALAFWPSKIPHESRAAGVVAALRNSTVREILTRMRSLSREDLGNDPEPWLKKYYKGGAQPNPQGGANGEQPSASDTNRTPAAAAPRRSP
jgi:hypothetical protein